MPKRLAATEEEGAREDGPTYKRSKYVSRSIRSILERLDQYGVAVVPKVLSKSECKARFEGIVHGLERVVEGFKYSEPATWTSLRKSAYLSHSMLMQHFGVAWLQDVVEIRQNPKIAALWAALWSAIEGRSLDPHDLLTSADGIAVYLNPAREVRHGFAPVGKNWLHTDRAVQDPTHSIQGFVNLLPTHKGDAAFHCLIGSHKLQSEYASRFFASDKKMPRFNKLKDAKELHFFTQTHSCQSVCVKARPGDLVLWDSRLVHEGLQAQRPSPSVAHHHHQRRDRQRAVVYVSMQPRSFSTKADRARKRLAWKDLRMTCHNAARGVRLFAQTPRTYGNGLHGVRKNQVRPVLTDLGKRLFCTEDEGAAAP